MTRWASTWIFIRITRTDASEIWSLELCYDRSFLFFVFGVCVLVCVCCVSPLLNFPDTVRNIINPKKLHAFWQTH